MRSIFIFLFFWSSVSLAQDGGYYLLQSSADTTCGTVCIASDPNACDYIKRLCRAGYSAPVKVQKAIDTLFMELKSANLYDKFTDFYPCPPSITQSISFVYAYGAKNNTNSSLIATAPPIMSSKGINFNQAYCNLGIPISDFSKNAGFFCGYHQLNRNAVECSWGIFPNSGAFIILYPNRFGILYSYMGGGNQVSTSSYNAGFYVQSRTSYTSFKTFKNDTLLVSNTVNNNGATYSYPSANVYWGAYNSVTNGAQLASRNIFSFFGFSKENGLLDAEVFTLTAIVNKYEKALDRNVF